MAHLCEHRIPQARHKGGGFADYTVVFAEQCYPIDDATGMIEAAVAEPLACCLHSTSRIGVRQGDCVAILGGGVNAQLFLQLTRLQGARRVVLIDSIEERLQMASKLGADEVIDCSTTSFERIEHRFPRGADIVINTRGSMEFTELAFRICAIGARLLCYGVAGAGNTVPIEPHIIWRKEIQLIGGRSYNNTFGAAVDLIDSRRIQVAPPGHAHRQPGALRGSGRLPLRQPHQDRRGSRPAAGGTSAVKRAARTGRQPGAFRRRPMPRVGLHSLERVLARSAGAAIYRKTSFLRLVAHSRR